MAETKKKGQFLYFIPKTSLLKKENHTKICNLKFLLFFIEFSKTILG